MFDNVVMLVMFPRDEVEQACFAGHPLPWSCRNRLLFYVFLEISAPASISRKTINILYRTTRR